MSDNTFNNIKVASPLSLFGDTWGNWVKTSAFNVPAGESLTFNLYFDLTGVSIPPTRAGDMGQDPFRVEVRYFNGTINVIDEVVFSADGGSYEVNIEAGNVASLSAVSVRMNTMFGSTISEQVQISSDYDALEFHLATCKS